MADRRFLSDVCPPGERLGKHPVLGGTAEVADFVARGYLIHYALHLNARKKWSGCPTAGPGPAPEAHAAAIPPARPTWSPPPRSAPGVVVCAHAATSFGVRLGGFIHMYTNCFVGHDTLVAD